MSKEEQFIAMHDYYDELLMYFTRLREVDPSTGVERQIRINNDTFFIDNMASFSQEQRTLYQGLLNTFESNRKENGTIIRDNKQAGGNMADFFSQENFVKRLCLHKFFITKSKIVKKSTLTQYYNSLNSTEKGRNFLDWDSEFDEKMAKMTR